MKSTIYKFGTPKGNESDEEFFYPQIYSREQTSGPDRLVIAPKGGQIDLMLKLARCWRGPYGILFVLVVPRGDEQSAGRYQSPDPIDYPELERFFMKYQKALETDGRHHIWIASASGEGTLVYDQHNVIFAYGSLDPFERILTQEGFLAGQVRFPVPHAHHYHSENDIEISKLLNHWGWIKSPLSDSDEYAEPGPKGTG